VRELRQHASRYLARVRSGETIEVTDRGRPIARLVPIRERTWQDLIEDGVVTPPSDVDDDLAALEPIDLPPRVRPPSELVDEGRDER